MTHLRAFPIVGFRTDADIVNAWNATRPDTVTISLDDEGRTLVQTTSEDSVYLVLGSDDRSFNQLAAGHGLEVTGGRSLVVGLEIPMRDDIDRKSVRVGKECRSRGCAETSNVQR